MNKLGVSTFVIATALLSETGVRANILGDIVNVNLAKQLAAVVQKPPQTLQATVVAQQPPQAPAVTVVTDADRTKLLQSIDEFSKGASRNASTNGHLALALVI